MIINGKQIAQEVLDNLKDILKKNQSKLRLVAILVGDVPGLKKFVELKDKSAKSIGIESKSYFFPENISEENLIKEVTRISSDSEIDGVFVELPLPKHINPQNILNTIPIEKDLDALSQTAQDKYFSGDFSVLPPAVEATRILLDKFKIDLKNKKVAIFGQGFLVGKPVSYWLEKNGAEVYRIDISTKNPETYSKKADIIISGVGKPDLITGDMVKVGTMIIDFGYSKKEGRMVGDVSFESVAPKTSLITPVPGGMGPILIAAVLKNLILLKAE